MMRAGFRLLTFVAIAVAGLLQAHGAEAAKKKDDKPQRTYPPAVEKALTEFTQKAAVARRKYLEEGMAKIIAEVVKSSQADESAKKKLEEGAKTVVELCVSEFPQKLTEWLGRWMENSEEETIAQISQWPEEEAAKWPVPGTTSPEDQPVWAETIKAALTPAQFAEWNKKAAEKKRTQDEEITRYLKPMTERTKEQFKTAMETEMSDITTVLTFAEGRLAKLKAAADEAVTRSTDAWRDSQVKTIRGLSELERRQLFSRDGGGYSIGTMKTLRPEQQPAWSDALKAELSADEQQRWQATHADRTARRQQAFALLLTAELDKRIGFTIAQRERIFPLAEKPARHLIKTNAEADEDDEDSMEGVSNWNLQPQNFITAAQKMPEQEVRTILDPLQMTRWQEYCKGKPENVHQRRIAKADTQEADANLDVLVNEYLHKAALDQERRLFKSMLMRVEDAARITALKPESVAQLTLAARGAVERTMGSWRGSLEEYLRNNLEGARAGEIGERIAGMGNLSENISRDKNPQDQPLWKDTISVVLTTDQNAIWQGEVDARIAYRARATAALALSELDRRRRLTSEQVAKLEPLVAKVVKDYTPDITRYLSNDWDLRSYYLLVPLLGIPDSEMKNILTPAQFKLVQEHDLAQVHNYWEGIKSYHEQRMKEKK